MRDLRSRTHDLVRAAALASAIVLVVAACSGSANAGWTFAPEPSTTPAPSAASSAAPSGGVAPASPAAPASAAASAPAGSVAAGGATVDVTAQNIAFTTPSITVPAGKPFTIDFDNEDSGIPHNIDISDASGNSVFKGAIVTGPIKTSYQVPALAAGGTYTFKCDVHPNMTGTITLQ